MKKKMLAVVIFEDKKEERQKAREIISQTPGLIDVAVPGETLDDIGWFFGERFSLSCSEPEFSHYANLMENSVALKSGRAVFGIITDLNMPIYKGGPEEQVGLVVAFMAKELGIHVVVCTGNHHKGSFWAEFLIKKLGVPIVHSKNWQDAIEILKNQLKTRS